MSPSPEPSPAPETLAVDDAHTKLLGNCGHAVGMRTVFCHTCGPRILTRLYLAAKIEGIKEGHGLTCCRRLNCGCKERFRDKLAKLREEAK